MTLDDFLRALEGLIDDREASEDPPGEGNFGCEECRSCNHCRFCIGCDSCEDCTYCDECIDCTSATQSKRCVSCQKISYCEDSRECKGSRYLTLCVSCTDCVHCLACVGLEGSEFYVLNEKRTRKEYFALLRQVQELMAGRMHGGWRPPNIGLASDIVDPLVAGRDAELTAAPWLEDERDAEPVEREGERDVRRASRGHDDWSVRDEYGRAPRDEYGRDDHGRDEYGRPRGYPEESELPARSEPAPRGADRGDGRRAREPHGVSSMSSPPLPEPREPVGRDWIRDPPEYGSSYPEREDERTRPHTRDPHERPRSRQDFGGDLGRELGDEDWARDLARDVGRDVARDVGVRGRGREPEREPSRGRDPERSSEFGRSRDPERELPRSRDPERELPRSREPERESARGDYYERGHDDRAHEGSHADAPRRQEQQPTQPFVRSRERDPFIEPRPASRPAEHSGRGRDELVRDPARDELEPWAEDSPGPRDREASSPWLDDAQAQAHRLAKRGSLRRAGRPARPDGGAGRDGTGTGSASERSEGTNTGSTGLRLGRKPKRR